MPLKFLLPVANKTFLALAVLATIGAVVSLAEGVLGYGATYFGTALLAVIFGGAFWGISFAAGAAHRTRLRQTRK